jgi:hypothetical protein
MIRLFIFLLLLTQLIWQENLFGQRNFEIDSIPKEHKLRFKIDNERYWQYISPTSDSVGKAYNIWRSAVDGKWKDYNTDSAESAFKLLQAQEYLRTIEFIKHNLDSYALFTIYNINSFTG